MDPLQKMMNGDVKSDLGFYYHEDSHDEVGFQIDKPYFKPFEW